MNEFESKTLKNADLAANDCYDRAEVCDAMSDDYFRYLDKAEKQVRLILDSKKLDMEKEIELKKIEVELNKLDLEKLKLQDEKSLKNPKFWVETLGIPVTLMSLKMIFWIIAAIESAKFETTSIATLSASKGVFRYVTDGIGTLMRDK